MHKKAHSLAQKIAQLHEQGRTHGMKDHPDRTARLHLLEYMFAGHSWQSAVSQSGLHIARSTAYRLRQRARDEDKAALVFLDDRHGHPYKLTEPVRVWMVEFCTTNPQVASSRVQAELKTTFGIEVSVSQINRVRAAHRVTRQGHNRIQGHGGKN
jgi:transposase